MKFLLLASFLAFCAASTLYGGKKIFIDDDGIISITSPSGKRLVISKAIGYEGQKVTDITIAGPNIPTKKIQINERNKFYDGNRAWSSEDSMEEDQIMRGKGSFQSEKSQIDVLFEILREYQGSVSEPLFEKIVEKIGKAVKKGEISPKIYEMLMEFDQIDDYQGEFGNQGVFTGSGNYVSRYIPQIQGGRVVVVQEQIPLVQRGIYGQNWGKTRYVNPILEKFLQGRQSNWGTYSGFPSQQNMANQILARQLFNSGISGGLQTQQDIVDEILAQQQFNGGIPVGFQTQQNIIDEILAKQQLNSEISNGLYTKQKIINELKAQQLNNEFKNGYQSGQNILDEILTDQQFGGYKSGKNIVEEMLEEQQFKNDVVNALQAEQDVADDLYIQQQKQFGGFSSGWQNGQNIVDNMLRRQQNNGITKILQHRMGGNMGYTRGMFGRNGATMTKYLTGSQQVPYSQKQSFGGLWGMLMNKPAGYSNKGYSIMQEQPTVMKIGRGMYVDNVPQFVY